MSNERAMARATKRPNCFDKLVDLWDSAAAAAGSGEVCEEGFGSAEVPSLLIVGHGKTSLLKRFREGDAGQKLS